MILVDKDDNQTGVMEKMEAHRKAALHRAFSIFVFNSQGQLMIQQRALHKYHSPGLWTNTCCSHPRPGETTLDAAHRRLIEEMGFDCDLNEVFHFTYKASFSNNLTEHEIDHVFFGVYDSIPALNSDEVSSYRMVSLNEIAKEMSDNPEMFTIWFRVAFDRVQKYHEANS